MEKKKSFKLNNLAGLLAALLCIVAFNSVLIVNEKGQFNSAMAYDKIANPFNFFDGEANNFTHSTTPGSPMRSSNHFASVQHEQNNTVVATTPAVNYYYERQPEIPAEYIVQAAQDDIDASLTKEQKAEIKSTVDATKKIISTLQWKEMDNKIADAMTYQEKARVKQEYVKSLQQSPEFKYLEQNLKASYEKLDWEKINSNVNQVLVRIQLDSLQTAYSDMIIQLNKVQTQVCADAKVSVSPMPDQSIEEIEKSKAALQQRVDCIKAVKNPKKVVKL